MVRGDVLASFSALEIPFPGNRDCRRRRRGSNGDLSHVDQEAHAGYVAEGQKESPAAAGLGNDQHITCLLIGTRVRVSPIPWSSPDAYPSGGNPSLSHRWAKWHSRLMAPIESRTPDWRMGFGLQTARKGLKYPKPVMWRTAISRVSKSSRGDLQPGKVAMPRGPRSEKRPPT